MSEEVDLSLNQFIGYQSAEAFWVLDDERCYTEHDTPLITAFLQKDFGNWRSDTT